MKNSTQRRTAPLKEPAGSLHVVDVARRADVTPSTVRYYARIGLLNPGRDDSNGYRRFRDEDLQRVQFIRKAQALGLTIADIRLLLVSMDDHQPVCGKAVELLRLRLADIQRSYDELAAIQSRIERVLDCWSNRTDDPVGHCPLIEQVDLE